jgi:thiol-disulfide isomerase/thioredoxin
MKYVVFVWALFFLSGNLQAQNVKVVNFAELEKEFKKSSDSLYVVNFCATWCGPCVAEMKFFIQAQDTFNISKVKFIYVSLDMEKMKVNVVQFVKKKGMKGGFYILKDDPNVYINKIDKTWEGQIPFTLLIKPDKTYITHNAPFESFDQLKNLITTHLK